ncbi:PREDICTED: uncharacterized protein K02A2.6-like [Vollenhovia emeryi]|uniref:uncharacterized protein K02A2.6-like n=1 Tax=Vollenhovia emeryi TaxID=411798 RepID=UPI0005F4F471|nr:PREDICTED: uncharacterized protein K02A2.6-like [Vollenhovia emeryi]
MWPIRAKVNKKRTAIGQVSERTDTITVTANLREEFPDVFAAGLGTFTKGELELYVKEGTQPKFIQPRRVPLAMRVLVENEIGRLRNCKIIEPVEYSEWGTPVVPILKKDGTVRLCGDYKTTLNKHLQVDHFPLPRVEEVLDTLRGGVFFTKLDLAEAYQQVPLKKESKKLAVISTHVGLFRYNRLPYGVATGPGSFQRIMTSLLLGIPGVMVFLDDIIIAAPDYETHMSRLREVLRRLNDSGLRLKDEKCKFLQKEIKYLGFRVNAAGIFPSGEKIESVKRAPEPKNVSELKSVLGFINYYARFISDITNKLRPLYECLKTGKFKWTKECTQAYESIKKDLSSELMLAHFDPAKPIVLTCDASPYGVSAILSHRDGEGGDRPVCFASRTLSSSEKGYPHHDKEGLAVIFGIQKFYQYLFENHFLIQTDSTALSKIFHPDRSVPEISTARLQRWAIFLSAFRYDIKHIRGDKNYADWLSRLPVKGKETTVTKFAILQDSECLLLRNIQAADFATLDWKKVQTDTREDATLCKVIRYCIDGWPGETPKDKEIIPFWEKREALSIENNCVLWGHRIIILAKLRNLVVLHELHHSHFGGFRMKASARSYVWWPKLDEDIEMITRKCKSCLKLRKNPPKVPLTPWPWPLTPWHRIHADFLGPLFGKMVLVVIDSHSKWPKIFVVPNMREETIIAIFERMFSQFGFPAHVVTDNFSSFRGDKFQTMIKKGNIRHSTSPPHCPATNGAAENLVDTIKRKVKAWWGIACLYKAQSNNSYSTIERRFTPPHKERQQV